MHERRKGGQMQMTRLTPKIGFAQIVLGRHVNASGCRRSDVHSVHHWRASDTLVNHGMPTVILGTRLIPNHLTAAAA